MATTKIWKIMGRLDRVVEYAKDEGKTENPNWSETDWATLRDVMDYAMNDYKTEMQHFVTGVNCNASYAREQMQLTKQQFGKTDGILAWHGYQSFAPGEVDAKTAHAIGIRMAQELYPDFQVVVATHLNTKCFHNHFVVNSVSHVYGKKFNACKESYRQMRAVSDRLCKEYNLSVIKHPERKGMHYSQWQAEQHGKPSWRSVIRTDVDTAIKASLSWTPFISNLKKMGYEVKTNVKHVAVRPPGKERWVRLRSLGENYTEYAIKQRIVEQFTAKPMPKHEGTPAKKVAFNGSFKLYKITFKSLRALYYHYLHKLRGAQNHPEKYPYIIKEDLSQFDRINAQTKFLVKHKIDTVEQLAEFKAGAVVKVETLTEKRKELYNEKRRASVSPERVREISAKIGAISRELKEYRNEVKLCDGIVERVQEIKRKQSLNTQEISQNVKSSIIRSR